MTTIVYTTDSASGVTWDRYSISSPIYRDEPDPHCFVCSRHTDHWGEHDSLVALGLASYGEDGSVYVTEFASTPDGEYVRAVYDRAIDRAVWSRGVTLIKPEGDAITAAHSAGILLPGQQRR